MSLEDVSKATRQKLIEDIKQADSMEVLPARFTFKELLDMNYEGLQLVKMSPFYSFLDLNEKTAYNSPWKEAYLAVLEDLIEKSNTKLARALDEANDQDRKDKTWLKIRNRD